MTLRGGVVWALWSLMLLLALVYVGRFGANAPYYDEWGMVSLLDGARTVDASWLWDAHNDHRIPVPKLVLLGLYMLGGWDFRVAMFVNVLLLAGAAALLIRSTGPRIAFTATFFPLALLHWGHFENLLWGWQVTQVLPVFIVLLILAVIARAGLRPSAPAAAACGIGTLLLPLCGVPGLVYAPGLALWLAVVGWLRWRSDGPGNGLALALWCCAALTLLLVPLYFVGLATTVEGSPNLIAVIKSAVLFVGQGIGPAALPLRPYSYAVVLALGLGGLAALLPALRSREAATRERAFGLLLFLSGILGLALAVGIARSGSYPPRYYLQAAPALAWVYLVSDLHYRPVAGAVVKAGLVGLVAVAAWFNYSAGLEYARSRAADFAAFVADVQRGTPPSSLVARHQRALLPFPESGGAYYHSGLTSYFEALQREGVGIFAELAPEPPLREVPLDQLAAMTPLGDAAADWLFDTPVRLVGLRLLPPVDGSGDVAPYTSVYWRSADEEYAANRRYHHWWYRGEPEARVWIDDRVQALRVEVEDPGAAFDLPTILVLLPEVLPAP